MVFGPETKISIPMRNLKQDAKFKGCAFQIETEKETRAFMAPTLADKNNWARKLNVVMADLRSSGNFVGTVGDENAGPTTPVSGKSASLLGSASVDRHAQQQKAAVQQLAQSLQPRKTASRLPPTIENGVLFDRTAEIEDLKQQLQTRDQMMREKERELSEAVQKLQQEQHYREQITQGVEKWRQDLTRQKDQKIQDTRERLEEECQRSKQLEEENGRLHSKEEEAAKEIKVLQERVRQLEEELEAAGGLRQEIEKLRVRLEKEMEFVQVLEHDTQQMAEELVSLGRQHVELKERYAEDTESYRSQCAELRQQLQDKEEENLALREENGQLRLENKRLQETQNRMHREFFFSMALSIKLSLAQQGIYSNADLNLLYESILTEPYAQWTKAIEARLVASQITVPGEQPNKPAQPAPAPAPTPKKKGLFGLF